MAELVRLARAPYPLPLGALTAPRSLLSLENLVDAIDTVLAAPAPLRRPLIVADPDPLGIADMIAALRRGLGRGPGLIPAPHRVIESTLRIMGKADLYQRVAHPLVVDASALTRLGWRASSDTRAALAELMRG
jgi:UDP-glucose 4-epimerase